MSPEPVIAQVTITLLFIVNICSILFLKGQQVSIFLKTGRVRAEWADYNGHMNLAYYIHLFDGAWETLLGKFNIGEDAAKKELVSIFKGEKVPDEVYQNPFELKYHFHNSGNTFHPTEAILPNEVLPLEVSRGCRFKCKFCGFALLGRKMTDEYVRTRNNIFNELMHNYENFGTTDYNILCDTFNESIEKLLMMKEIFDEFNKITGEQIQFNCYARLELIHSSQKTSFWGLFFCKIF